MVPGDLAPLHEPALEIQFDDDPHNHNSLLLQTAGSSMPLIQLPPRSTGFPMVNLLKPSQASTTDPVNMEEMVQHAEPGMTEATLSIFSAGKNGR